MRAVMTKAAREGVPDIVSQKKFGIGIGNKAGRLRVISAKARDLRGPGPA